MDSAATGAANPDRPTPPAPPKLTVRCGGQIRSADPADGELTIGRDPASSIHFNFSWMSRTHVRLRPEGATWVAIDSSRNGMFVDGVRHESVPIADRMTIKLGDADGFAVDLFVGDDTPTTSMTTPATAPRRPPPSNPSTPASPAPARRSRPGAGNSNSRSAAWRATRSSTPGR